jgi:hypothetical protein
MYNKSKDYEEVDMEVRQEDMGAEGNRDVQSGEEMARRADTSKRKWGWQKLTAIVAVAILVIGVGGFGIWKLLGGQERDRGEEGSL